MPWEQVCPRKPCSLPFSMCAPVHGPIEVIQFSNAHCCLFAKVRAMCQYHKHTLVEFLGVLCAPHAGFLRPRARYLKVCDGDG